MKQQQKSSKKPLLGPKRPVSQQPAKGKLPSVKNQIRGIERLLKKVRRVRVEQMFSCRSYVLLRHSDVEYRSRSTRCCSCSSCCCSQGIYALCPLGFEADGPLIYGTLHVRSQLAARL